jgi:hypothetical protein
LAERQCPECASARDDFDSVCPACGAPPHTGEHRESIPEGTVRTTDLEPYTALRYIARLFKVLATLMVVMLVAEVVTGLASAGREAIPTLVGEATRFLVLAGLMWAGGDVVILIIDLGHDVRVSKILLGRINAALHRTEGETPQSTTDQRSNISRLSGNRP